MELNRVQLLVHDDTTLAKFYVDHNILNNVLIESLGPSEDANLVEGEGKCIPVQTWMIHQVGLKFPPSPLLKRLWPCGVSPS